LFFGLASRDILIFSIVDHSGAPEKAGLQMPRDLLQTIGIVEATAARTGE
jgi:hypothetical protein